MGPESFDPLKIKFALLDREWQALVAVKHIGRDGWPVTVREAARYSECNISVAHRALTKLVELDLLKRNPRFRGGFMITDRGYAVMNA